MKRVFIIIAGALLLAAPPLFSADALTEALQKGLFEEEANQNLDAAIKAYQDVLSRADEQRRVAATALFRLAECYRKQSKTNEASAEYRRLVRDYADQATLVNLSRQNLTGLGVAASAITVAAEGSAGSTDEEEKEIRRIKLLIKDSPDLINARNQEIYRTGSDNPRITSGTVLHQAAYKGHLQVASYLLANGSDPNARSSEDSTPLFYAAQNGHKNMAELLLTKGASPNVGSYRGTALHAASSRGFRAVAEVLLAHKADVNAKGSAGKTPLHAAAEAGFLPVAELLIAQGADVNALYALPWNPRGSINRQLTEIELYDGTPLHFAVQKPNPEMTQLLLAKGANVEARSGAGLTPLHYAGHNGNAAIAGLLIENKADVNATGSADSRFSGWTALHMAIFHRQNHLVSLLLEKGANPSLTMEDARMEYRTALHNAVEYGFVAIAELLLKHKADINAHDFQGNTPLLRATRKHDAAMVELLLTHDADIKATDPDGNTPLVRAARDNHVRIAELLLAKGADPNARNSEGFSLLAMAMGPRSSQNQPFHIPPPQRQYGGVTVADDPARKAQPTPGKTMVELLIEHGADVNAPITREDTSATPLQHALSSNMTNWVRLFLEKGGNPNVPYSRPDYKPRTMLHHVVGDKQSVLFADLLLRHGADVNGLDDHGRTPLFRAIAHNNTNMVDLLLRHNADLTAVLDDGATPLLHAVQAGNVPIAEQLLAKGASPNAMDNDGHAALHIALGAKPAPGGLPLGGFGAPQPVFVGQALVNPSVPSRSIRNVPRFPAEKPASPPKGQSMTELLLAHQADPNLRDKKGNTPLSLAIQKSNDEAVQLLLARKADPEGTDFRGYTPLHFAASSANVSGAELLLGHKASLNAKNNSGQTPLHFAVTLNGFTNFIALLIDKGADVNACDNSSDTPLHKALRAGFNNSDLQRDALQILLDRGADVTKSCEGKPNPFDHVRVKDQRYVELLQKYHPKKLARVDLTGPVRETLWFWEANQKQTLSEVIAAVGLKEKANPGDIRILRDNPRTGLKEELPHNLVAIRGGSAQDVPVKDKDKIIVAER